MMTEGKITAIVIAGLVALSAFMAVNGYETSDKPESVYVTKEYKCSQLNTKMHKYDKMSTVDRPSVFSVSYDVSDKSKAVVQFNFSSSENNAPAQYNKTLERWSAVVKDGGSHSSIEIDLGEYPMASFKAKNGYEVQTALNSCTLVK